MWLAQTPPFPSTPPTWENLIPWIIGFLAMLVSGMIWFVLRDLRDSINKLGAALEAADKNNHLRLKENEAAIDRVARAVLTLVIAMPTSSEAAKAQATEMKKDVDEAERRREKPI